MNTKPLEKFAQAARRQLHEQVRARLEQVLRTDSPELRAKAKLVADLNKQIARSSRQAVVEQVAYTWFNRFCALRYMDANRYTRLGVVSPAVSPSGETFTQPGILQEAKAGHIDPDLAPFIDSQRVLDLLAGRTPSPNPQQEAYRLLLLGSCHQYHEAMPFLFAPIDDYSELLMPDDLLSASSILQQMRQALTDEACQDVEVIGWLYQFYISEKKDAVIKSKKKIDPADIPAATQLFTPNWIVRYLVENSLGRLWLLNRPGSRLAERMDYLVESEQLTVDSESDQLSTVNYQLSTVEDLRVCDPAVGSGHMLTYAFDLLYAIYEEEGYDPVVIPRLILQKNLVGLEIDERAAALAAFALTMKARAKDRRFFRRGVQPNITVLAPILFTEAELDAEVEALLPPDDGRQTADDGDTPASSSMVHRPSSAQREALRHDLNLFREADNVGSLLRPRLSAGQLRQLHTRLSATTTDGQLQLFDQERRRKASRAIAQAIPLAQKYDVVVTNPPYMGGRGMNSTVKDYLNKHFNKYKSDLFAAFIVRNLQMTKKGGQLGFMTPFVWMFISSYEKLRQFLINKKTITTLVQLEYSGFEGATVPICAFTLENTHRPDYKGGYVRLSDFRGAANQSPKTLEAIQNPDCGWFYRASATDFKKIPGSPIAYWAGQAIIDSFESMPTLSQSITLKSGMSTTNNALFLRVWHEISERNFETQCRSHEFASKSQKRWFPYVKGGPYRRWFGNLEHVVNWKNDGEDIKNYVVNNPNDPNTTHWSRRIFNTEYFFVPLLAWTRISSSSFSGRYYEPGTIFSDASNGGFAEKTILLKALCFLNSNVASSLLAILSPTLNYHSGEIANLPFHHLDNSPKHIDDLISLSKTDWNSYETSWDFTTLPLLEVQQFSESLATTYATLRQQWQTTTLEMQRLEEENNRLFIDAYGLQDELTHDVPLAEITLTCNPHYRYGSSSLKKRDWQALGQQFPAIVEQLTTIAAELAPDLPAAERHGLEQRLLADTMREFVSYAVGCMFGRYSLDQPGLILANQGEGLDDYLRQVAGGKWQVAGGPSPETIHSSQSTIHNSQFLPDDDNAIPILDGEWFSDDITERFKKFLRVTFGETHYEENLAFIETALGRDIRSYFLRDFYSDHVKTYKKRPIYWLFSSAKGSFNALIYMHRYRPDTVSIILNDYLREYRAKLTARKNHLEGVSVSAATPARDKTQALKEIATIDKILKELRDYEDDILYPLATRQVQIDLDDGVKVNYNKLGKALKKVSGLNG